LTGRAVDALASFSVAPLVLVMPLAVAVWLIPAGMPLWLVADALVFHRTPSAAALGWFWGAVAWCLTLSVLAVIAHYLGRIFIEIKRRPRYFVRRIVDKSNHGGWPPNGQLRRRRVAVVSRGSSVPSVLCRPVRRVHCRQRA